MEKVYKMEEVSIYSLKREVEQLSQKQKEETKFYLRYNDERIWGHLVNIGILVVEKGFHYYDDWKKKMKSELDFLRDIGVKSGSIDIAIKDIWESYFYKSKEGYECIHVCDYAYEHTSKWFRFLSHKYVIYTAMTILLLLFGVFILIMADGISFRDGINKEAFFVVLISWVPFIVGGCVGGKHPSLLPLMLYISFLLTAELKTILFSDSIGALICVETIHKTAWFWPMLLLTPIFYCDKGKIYTKEKSL